MKMIGSKKWEDRFFNSRSYAWQKIRTGLSYKLVDNIERLQHQPLLWNPTFTGGSRKMLGTRTHLSWGAFERAIGQTYGDWCKFIELSEDVKNQKL